MLICSQMKPSIWWFWNYPGVEDTGFSVLRNSAGTEVLTGTPWLKSESKRSGKLLVRTPLLGKTADPTWDTHQPQLLCPWLVS